MDEKPSFGSLSADELKVGDIVEWSKWNSENQAWTANYGVIMEIKNQIKGNRMISVTIVLPLAGSESEMEFFTPSLKLVSRGQSLEDNL